MRQGSGCVSFRAGVRGLWGFSRLLRSAVWPPGRRGSTAVIISRLCWCSLGSNAIYKNRLKKRGVRIISIKEPTDDSPAGQFMEGVIEEVDAFYSANLSQEVRRGQRKVAERGYYPGNRAPYGYKLKKVREEDGNAFHNIFVKDPDTAPIVRRIFGEAIAGRTHTDIRQGLDRDRVPPPEPKNKKDAKSEKWHDSTIYDIIHNLHYAGFIVWGVSSQSGDPPVIAKGRHESIVSEDEFSLAGRVMASKAPQVTHPKQTASVYMLSRMLQCRHCGESLTVRPSKRQSSRYYQCRTRRLDGVEVCGCPNLNVQKLDERVLRVVLDDILCPQQRPGRHRKDVGRAHQALRRKARHPAGYRKRTRRPQRTTVSRDGSVRGKSLHGGRLQTQDRAAPGNRGWPEGKEGGDCRGTGPSDRRARQARGSPAIRIRAV